MIHLLIGIAQAAVTAVETSDRFASSMHCATYRATLRVRLYELFLFPASSIDHWIAAKRHLQVLPKYRTNHSFDEEYCFQVCYGLPYYKFCWLSL